MKTYAFVINGEVQEIVPPRTYDVPDPALEEQFGPELWGMLVARVGLEIPIEERFHPDFVLNMVDITDVVPQPDQRWTYADGVFTAPYDPSQDFEAINKVQRDQLMSAASLSMTPVLLSLQLGEATDQESIVAKQWQDYYRALRDIDVSVANPEWPIPPETV
jgi:hypothetical protein